MARKASKANRSYGKSSKAANQPMRQASGQPLNVQDPSIGSLKAMGSLAFLFGIMIALLTGILLPGAPNVAVTSLLVVLGVVAGFLNVTKKESNSFLVATVSLVLVAHFGGQDLKYVILIGKYLESIFNALLTFVIPAIIIVALKQVYNLEED